MYGDDAGFTAWLVSYGYSSAIRKPDRGRPAQRVKLHRRGSMKPRGPDSVPMV